MIRETKLLVLFVAVVLFSTAPAFSQLSITNSSPQVIDFSTTVSGVNNGAYAGTGFQPSPAAGQLDSDAWAVTGLTSGSLAFGGTQTTADYARGPASEAVSSGGFYAFTGAPGSAANPSFMVQPIGSDFTPGTLTLRIQNNTASTIDQINISYNLFIRNDQGRANSFNFSYSTDNITYIPVPALDYTSPEAADALGWVQVGSSPSRSTSLLGLNMAPGGYLYIRWTGDDVSGTNFRDEFGLDDITVRSASPLAADATIGGRVMTPNGRGIRNVFVTLQGGDLVEPMRAITNGFGYYSFEGLEAGQTYILTVDTKRHAFNTPSRVISLNDSISDIDFVAEQ